MRGSQRLGMSTKKDAARPFGLGAFFRGGRYRTRTAAEATAACGGNREPRLGQRSDFSKPCQGAAEKSANATRTGASRQIPSRFPTPRNVYQERCRQTIRSGGFFSWWAVQDSNYFSPDTGRKRTKAGYHHEGGILPFESLCGKPAYSSGMPALAQASRVAASQTLACTSPMWALPSSSMHRRLWPMPPPME